MARIKGSKNKETVLPIVYTLTPEQRLQMLVGLLVEMLAEEGRCNLDI